MPRQVQQGIDFGHRDPFRPGADFDDLLPGFDFPLGEYAAVETGPAMRNEQSGHPRLTQPQAHPITRHARLGDLKKRLANAVAVTDADLVIADPFHGEVLAEVSRLEVIAPEFSCPVTVRINLVHQHRALFATVSGEIALTIPINVESSNHPRPHHRRLPNTGEDRSAAPFHIARKTYIYGGQGRQSPHLTRCAAL